MDARLIRTGEWGEFFAAELRATPVVVILRGLSPSDAADAAKQAWSAGVRLVEVTVEREANMAALDAVVRAAPEGVPVGAGTVTTPQRLGAVADAGARFAVAPGLDTDTVHAADERGIPFLPGVATPTEAGHALRLGVTTLKAFPASTLGPAWISALAAPLPELRIVATGGVRASNAADYLRAGALGVGVGASVVSGGLPDLLNRIADSWTG